MTIVEYKDEIVVIDAGIGDEEVEGGGDRVQNGDDGDCDEGLVGVGDKAAEELSVVADVRDVREDDKNAVHRLQQRQQAHKQPVPNCTPQTDRMNNHKWNTCTKRWIQAGSTTAMPTL